ncbi:MAG: hypothetical protein IJZ75_02880 [Clostridia bacterium]|nr:hypothetical protein [Clostridia bacterium]
MELLFKNKTKNIFAIASSAMYFISLVITIIQGGVSLTLQSAICLLMAAGVGVFLFAILTAKMDYGLKRHIFTISFGLMAVAYLVSSIAAFITILFYLEEPLVVAIFAMNFVVLIAHIFCFVAARFEFRYPKILRTGALLYIAATLLLLLLDFIRLGGFEYFASLPDGVAAISISSVIRTVIILMFYASLFLLATNKDSE